MTYNKNKNNKNSSGKWKTKNEKRKAQEMKAIKYVVADDKLIKLEGDLKWC